jgi:probable HAF family extracellular repeat protein
LGLKNLGPGRAYGLNNKGGVVGVSWTSLTDRGFIYRNGETTIVGPESNDYLVGTILSDLNNHDVAVGSGVAEDHRSRALIWTEAEGLIRLNSLIEPDSGWWLTGAGAINDHGQIVGSGSFEGQALAYRLDPIPPRLSIQRDTTNLTVSWSPNWPGVVLEATEHLSTLNWQPVDTGGTNMVALTPDAPQRFFRLNLEALRGLCCPPQ